jgi:hypothetical protein
MTQPLSDTRLTSPASNATSSGTGEERVHMVCAMFETAKALVLARLPEAV